MSCEIDFNSIRAVPGFASKDTYDPEVAIVYGQELLRQGWEIAVSYFCAPEVEKPQLALRAEISNEVKSQFGNDSVIGPIVQVVHYSPEEGQDIAVDTLYHGAAVWQKKAE